MRRLAVALLLTSSACFEPPKSYVGLDDSGVPTGGDTDGDGDTDTDGDTDGDTDRDTDGDTDGDTDTDGDGDTDGGGDGDTDGDTDSGPAEICDNGDDDDLDGRADCADEDCVDGSNCVCIDAVVEGDGAALTTGNTTGAGGDYGRDSDAGCGSMATSGPDHAVAWTAPDDGCYSVNTFGSAFDTVLRVVDGCGGAEVFCNDDADDPSGGGPRQSELHVGGAAGAAYTFIVDGFDDQDSGAYVLNIEPAAPRVDGSGAGVIGSTTGTGVASGTVSGSSPVFDHSCTTPSESNSAIFSWTAPTTATVHFSTAGSSVDTVLSVFSAEGCAELGCNDDDDSAVGNSSSVTVAVEAGESYLVVVSGFNGQSGNYVLSIQ